MRISSIGAVELLSFSELDLDVPETLSVIVGPNGSGKTNLGRVARLAVAAVGAVAFQDSLDLNEEWSLAGRFGSTRFEARLGLIFDRREELDVLEDWARAAYLSTFQLQTTKMLAELDDLLPDNLRARDILARGQLVVRHDERRSDPWLVYWETSEPAAHLGLRLGNTLAPGPIPESPGWASSRSRPQEILRDADGKPVPDLAAPTFQSGWQKAYSQAFSSFVFADLLKTESPVEVVARRTNNEPELPALRRLMDRFPTLGTATGSHLTFAQVLDRLLSEALLVTDNRRMPVREFVDPAEINARPRMDDGSGLAVELLRLKMGDAADRDRFRAAQEVFGEVTGRRLEVRQEGVGTDRQQLRVTPVVVETDVATGRKADLPLRLAGAGVEESAWLSILLTGDYDTVILDEPATNVSAIAQRRLLRALQAHRRNRQTVMITHSADLVPVHDVTDLAVVTRLVRRGGTTKIHRPQFAQREFEDMKELLRQSHLRMLLFAAGVVLVEGPTEVDALETWLAGTDSPELPSPESSYVAFVSVGGDERFPKYAKLMEALDIPYAIVADGPAFAPGRALSKLPRPAVGAGDPDSETFDQAVARWQVHRVRTLATEFGVDDRKGRGEIEAFFETVDSAVWSSLHQEPSRKDKALLGYRFASRTPTPPEVRELWRLLRDDLGLTD
ncbi:TOPRIM nucleotidyl transferase/hydrolase domain-containing protein [Dactylosporangium sp. CS-047395]|uniref:ATP-dependent nuclease n=1 Tax=Dactylosporangium sp. CS-047395 TaxID=3239936 RepID=UPI003D900AE0